MNTWLNLLCINLTLTLLSLCIVKCEFLVESTTSNYEKSSFYLTRPHDLL